MLQKNVNRRRLLKGGAGVAAAAAASSAFNAPLLGARQDRTPVVFWASQSNLDNEGLQAIVDAFNEANPDIEVKLEQIASVDVTDSAKLITAVRGGSGPDVYMLDRFIVPERAANGLLQDLSKLLEDNGASTDLAEVYTDFAAEEATYQGAPYALPMDCDVRALFYNKTLLEEAGADLSLFDAANGPMTWDQLKEQAAKVDKPNASGDGFEHVGFIPWHGQGHLYTFGFSWGADFFDEDACEVTPASEQAIAATQWVYDYSAEYGANKLQAFRETAPGAPPSENPWIQGRMGANIMNNTLIAQNAEYAPDLDYGVTYLPVPNEGDDSTTWAGGWSLVIPQGAKEPDAAAKFMLFAAGEEGQKIYADITDRTPTVKAVLESKDLYAEDPARRFLVELLPTSRTRPPLPVGAKYWDDLQAAWQKIYLNEEEPKPALENAKKSTMTLLSPFCPIK